MRDMLLIAIGVILFVTGWGASMIIAGVPCAGWPKVIFGIVSVAGGLLITIPALSLAMERRG